MSTVDTFLLQSELWKKDLSKQVGESDTSCVLENQTTTLNCCTGTVELSGGLIEVAGRFLFTDEIESFQMAFTGGTGQYDNVVGEIVHTHSVRITIS